MDVRDGPVARLVSFFFFAAQVLLARVYLPPLMVDWKKFLPGFLPGHTAAADTTNDVALTKGAANKLTVGSGDSFTVGYTSTFGRGSWTTTTDSTSNIKAVTDTGFTPRVVLRFGDGDDLVVEEKVKTEIKEVVIPEQEPLSWTPQKGKLLALIHKDDVEDLDGTRLYKGPVVTQTRNRFMGTTITTASIRDIADGARDFDAPRTVSRGIALLKDVILGQTTIHGKNFGRTEKWLDAEGQIYYRKWSEELTDGGPPHVEAGAIALIEGEDSLFFSSGVMTELAKEGFGVLEVETPVEEADFYTTYGEEIVQYVDPIITELREPWGGWNGN